MSTQDKQTDAEEIIAESQQMPKTESVSETPNVQEMTDDVQNVVQEQAPDNDASDDENAKKTRDVIFVGTKPIMTYVTATLTQLSTQPVVTIKARGQRITQAVDVSQMIVKRMNTVGYVIKDVRIASDSLLSQDGKTRNVSTIEIDITKA